jgi:hypothetical protein
VYKRISLVSLMLSFLVAFPYTARATLTQWELTLHETDYFYTGFDHLPADIHVSQGTMDVTSTVRFVVDSILGTATSLTNAHAPDGSFPSALCMLHNCFTNLEAAGLFLGDNARIVGLLSDSICCIQVEVSFNGWFTRLGNFWENPNLPAIPPELRTIEPGEFVFREADINVRGLTFGTYSIHQVPEPSSFILAGIGLVALAARIRRRREAKGVRREA